MDAKTARYHLEQTMYYIRNIGDIVNDLEMKLSDIEKAKRDLEHEHELGILNAAQMIKLFIEERKILRQRRITLFELEHMREFKKLCDGSGDAKMLLGNVLANMNMIHGRQKNAVYVPKRVQGLRCAKRQYRPMEYFEVIKE